MRRPLRREVSVGAGIDRLRVLALRDTTEHPVRAVIAIVVVAVSATLLVAVLGIVGSVTGSVERLSSGIAGDAGLEVSGVTDSGFDQSLVPDIARTPGVATAVPMIRSTVGPADDRVLLLGVDQSVGALGTDLDTTAVDPAAIRTLVTTPGSVLLGTALPGDVGDTVRLGALDAVVAGRLGGGSDLADGHLVVTTIPTAQRITDRVGKLDSALLVLDADADPGTVRAALDDVTAGRAVVSDPGFRAAQAGSATALLRYTTLLAATISLVIAAFLVYTVSNMTVSQRRPTLSTLRAVGALGSTLARDLIVESAIVGLVGGALGSALGVVVGKATIGLLPPGILASLEARTTYDLAPWVIPGTVALCVVATTVASAVASREVRTVAPIEALVPVRASEETRRPTSATAALCVLAVVLGAGAAYATRLDLGPVSIAVVTVVFVAVVLACFALRTPLVALIATVVRGFGGPGTLGARAVRDAVRRTWATFMTVTIAVAGVVAITGANRDTIESAVDYFSTLGDTPVWVSSQPPDIIATSPVLSAESADRIRSVDGVADVRAGQAAYATIDGIRVGLLGFEDGTHHPLVSRLTPEVRGRVDRGEAVAISRDVSRTLGVDVGDVVALPTPSGVHRVEVAAVVPYFAGVAGAVAVGLPAMRTWFDRPGETYLEVVPSDRADVASVLDAVRAAAGDEAFVFTGQQAVDGVAVAVTQATTITTAIMWIVSLVAAVALLNTTMLSVLERRREFGMIRAMGGTRRFLVRQILAEATGTAIVGAVLGLVLGTLTQWLAAGALTEVIGLDITYHPTPVVLVFVLAAFALALLGSVLPAVRAARLDVIAALAAD